MDEISPSKITMLPDDVQFQDNDQINNQHEPLALRTACHHSSNKMSSAPPNPTSPPASLFAYQFNPSPTPSPKTATSSSSMTPNTTQTSSNNTSDTEPEWEFAITADMTRRLSLLPPLASHPTLPHLPTEIHLEIFSYLDKIDSCCLGLASSRTYSIYTSIYGLKLPLSTRRSGPNNLERAWEVVGKQMCKHCGVYRCELYKHLESWMPRGDEYCSMVQKFGPGGEEGREACFRVKPSKPRRCGKHPVRTTTRHQDDAMNAALVAAL